MKDESLISMGSKKKTIEWLEWAKAVILGAVIAAVISTFIVDIPTVSGMSMYPTLLDRDRVMVWKFPYSLVMHKDTTCYGDVVIIDSRVWRHRSFRDHLGDNKMAVLLDFIIKRNKNETLYIKRVIGKQGDHLTFTNDGKLMRNGQQIDEGYISEVQGLEQNFLSIDVPKGYVYVAGDNRGNSVDSREFGPVPVENIVGVALVKMGPFGNIHLLKSRQ